MKYKLILLLGVIVLSFNQCTVINPIRNSPHNTFIANAPNKPFDVIIVPGVPYYGESWSKIMRSRVIWSKFLLEKGYTNNIMYSGSAVYSPYVESKIMKLYGEALDIPSDKIYTEEQAEHSTENIYYSYALAQKMGFKNIALASDPYQTNNLRQYIKAKEYEISLLPILYDTIVSLDKTEPKIDPTSALVDTSTFVSIKDRESFLKRMKGTTGKNVSYK